MNKGDAFMALIKNTSKDEVKYAEKELKLKQKELRRL